MTDYRPLAEILRPQTLDDVVGQEHLVGPTGIIRKLLESAFLPSMIFWGPPGSGKTTLAHLLASLTNAHFVGKSAVTSSLADVRVVIKEAKEHLTASKQRTVFFLDEIHRFNKAQQDALLPHVEDGTIIFIGATTENPSFEVISPLLSRCRVLVLKPLGEGDLDSLIDRGLNYVKRSITGEARSFLKEAANGDGRAILTIVEIAASLSKNNRLSLDDIEEAAQKKMLQYDRVGEEHYNTISAFIKSMRASDVDACNKIGYPECQENLAHGVVYLALAKKDRSAYEAYFCALGDAKKYGNLPIPLNIRNAPTKLMKELGYGKEYKAYTTESLLPDKIKGKKYYVGR